MGWIYKLTSPTGQAYIGQTTGSVASRLKQHCAPWSKCRAIAEALRRYGPGRFAVQQWEFPDEELAEREQEFIRRHRTRAPRGYNLATESKQRGRGRLVTAATRRLASKKPHLSQPLAQLVQRKPVSA